MSVTDLGESTCQRRLREIGFLSLGLNMDPKMTTLDLIREDGWKGRTNQGRSQHGHGA